MCILDDRIINLLEELKNHYGMYIGKKDLNLLITFIYGCLHGIFIESGEIIEFLPEFQEFVQKYYGINRNIHVIQHWTNIIIFFTATEEEAFDEFYTLIDKYNKHNSETHK